MAVNIERLLRLTADYQAFSGAAQSHAEADPDELNEDWLDFVAAASAIPAVKPEKHEDQHPSR